MKTAMENRFFLFDFPYYRLFSVLDQLATLYHPFTSRYGYYFQCATRDPVLGGNREWRIRPH